MNRNDLFAWIYGILLLVVVGSLVFLVAWGKVEEKTSYGLQPLIIILTVLATKWADWRFFHNESSSGKTKRDD